MASAKIRAAPVEHGLEIMAVIGSNLAAAERELFYDVAGEVYSVGFE